MLDLARFRQRGYKAYRVEHVGEDAWLVRAGGPQDVAIRYPFADPNSALWRNLAAAGEDDDAIAGFATRHGHLCREQPFVRELYGDGIVVTDDEGNVTSPPIPEPLQGHAVAEPLELWRDTIRELRFLVALWDAIRAENTARLRSYMVERPAGVDSDRAIVVDHRLAVVDRFETRATWVGDRPNWYRAAAHPHPGGPLTDGDVVAAASRHLAEMLSQHLAAATVASRPAVSFDERSGRFSLWTTPESLLAGLWLQFAAAVVGSVELGQCQVCGQWFALAPPDEMTGKRKTRTDKRYCSNKCRVRWSREQRAKRKGADNA